ncbi:MAG: DUF342 domain-containing protein [Candidatus Eisenbacteria sp.]|nr:DUF342 domain-containing protein [Candidatus Eisenbacteria bacterium]
MPRPFRPDKQVESKEAAGRIVVETDRLFIHAALSLFPNESGERFSMEGVLALLKELGVTRGIDAYEIQALVDRVAESGRPVEREIIAAGREPIPGEDAYVEFPPLQRREAQETDPEDPVELSKRRIINIKADQVVALYHPLTDGVAGVNLRGEYLSAEPGMDATPGAERNLRREDDRIYSEIDGRLVIERRQIYVDEQVTIDDDLTVLYGDIDFVGNIIVWGNIESGVTIRCLKNISVGGSIYGSSIHCEGDLKVANGIVGSDETAIMVKGDLEATFVENADLRVWGDCRIRDSLVSSSVLCSGKLEMTGCGHMVSGQVSAKEGFFATTVGIPVGTNAKISVGTDALAIVRIAELGKEIEAAQERAEKIIEIERQVGPNTPGYKDLLSQKRAEIDRLLELLAEVQKATLGMQNERAWLVQRPKRNYDAVASVRRKTHEDTVIEFPLGRLVVRPAATAGRFTYDSEMDRVAILPLAA